jgi:hypothetical protein
MDVYIYYLNHMQAFIKSLLSKAPCLNCINCFEHNVSETHCTGHLKWDGFEFYYECATCGDNWPSPLDIDDNGVIAPIRDKPIAY